MKDKSQVFYRKFRPQLLSEVVGQEHVTRTLLNALATGHISHAYLFCGPRGTGKTSTGRIFAKAVNCTKPVSGGKGEPCNKCNICKSITEGRALDVIEIDAASHTGVDDIRDLIEKTSFAPTQAKYKVYIIDEVHMLSTSASNALLKTLEEPPPNVIFILATTETHKLLPTIISRCQRFDFRRLSYKDIEAKLNRICQEENISIEPEALRLIARNAGGGLRDAENLLEQLFAYFGDHIELAQVQKLLGMSGGEHAREILKCLILKDIAAGLNCINQAQNDGLDLKQLDREIVSYLRQLLLIKSGCEKDLDVTRDEIAELKQDAAGVSLEQVLLIIKLFGNIENELGNDSTLPLETALVEACIEPQATRPTVVTPQHNEPAVGTAPASRPVPAAHHNPPATQPAISKGAKEPAAADAIPKPAREQPPRPQAKTEAPGYSALEGAGSKLEQLQKNWRLLLELASEPVKKSPAAAILRSAGVRPIAADNDTVTLSFKYEIHKQKIEQVENRKIVAELISQFMGQPYRIKCVYEPAENHLVREAQKLGAQIIDVEEISGH
jgi:DNA polymerase-3 subunit gamma/tau